MWVKESSICKKSSFDYFFSLSVLHDEINIFLITPQSLLSFLYWVSSKYPVSKSNSNQYSLSKHSFNAISSFEIKSAVPWAYCASWIFAPMLVPERKSWLVKTLSLLLDLISLVMNTMFLANSFAFYLKMLSLIS